jgi:hypothetical protein
MNEEAVRNVLKAAVREAWRVGAVTKNPRDIDRQRAEVLEYAEQLVMPTVTAAIEQAREEGYEDGRASLAPVVAA